MPRVAAIVFALALTTCGNPATGLRIALNFNPSCTVTPTAYNIECVSAIEARLLDSSGTVLKSECNDIAAGTFVVANDLVAAEEVVPVLENVQPRENVTLDLRGYHALAGSPCDQELPPREALMFWGRSKAFDLTDATLEKIDLKIECRDACDCKTLNVSSSCPADFTQSERVCAPPLLCRRSCDTTSQCFDGQEGLTCNAGGRCEPVDEGMCYQCDSDNDCDDGLVCVRHTSNDLTEDFCAKSCPPASGLVACPGNMGCQLLNDTNLTRLP